MRSLNQEILIQGIACQSLTVSRKIIRKKICMIARVDTFLSPLFSNENDFNEFDLNFNLLRLTPVWKSRNLSPEGRNRTIILSPTESGIHSFTSSSKPVFTKAVKMHTSGLDTGKNGQKTNEKLISEGVKDTDGFFENKNPDEIPDNLPITRVNNKVITEKPVKLPEISSSPKNSLTGILSPSNNRPDSRANITGNCMTDFYDFKRSSSGPITKQKKIDKFSR